MSQEADAGAPTRSAGAPEIELPSPEKFAEWIKNPANERVYEEHLRRVVAGEFPELPPDVVASARVALEAHRKGRAVRVVREKFMALQELMQRPGGTMEAEERLRQCQGLIDEVTDALLEVPEPHRTEYLKQVLPIREKLRALRIEPD